MIASLASVPLAAVGSPSLWMIAAGVVVVAVLISAFWYGSRRVRARRDPGARPMDHTPPARAREDSWQTPDESTGGPDGPRHR
ncbi:DUF6479 family protein [Streptomyces sp. NRRL S-87]|uniref:DUF6479 family protein n=1 Tax=Streptomyces sp. NRRL S-87 TaxID=1463920 RepID=UPI0004C0D477|nr:DUF6479 family protein [Streptomyces sp. NRRL S-87]